MEDSPSPSPRLDSWKEIAAYLGHDVRTAMRWAKSQGLPVRRVPGAKGRSVFAFTADIDKWLAGQMDGEAGASYGVPLPAPGRARSLGRIGLWAAGAVALTAAGALLASGVGWAPGDPFDVTVSVDGSGIALRSPRGGTRVVHPFDASTVIVPLAREPGLQGGVHIDDDHVPEVLVALSSRQSAVEGKLRGGELISMATSGEVHWRFEFNDTVRFTGQSFSSPWAITDWQLSPGPGRRQIAVAAHHYIWWPGLVALLDERGRQVGSFVNTGWIEHVRWIDNGRIVISGFDNARNGGMLAVLDARHPNGHSPGSPDAAYLCESCPAGDPLLYVTFPRSELNLATSARFNRAQVQVLSDRLIATTREVDENDATAVYEFDLDLNFLHAAYGDRYWDAHHRLELEGRIHHSRENCPDKNGRAIDVWTRAQGWRHLGPVNGQPMTNGG